MKQRQWSNELHPMLFPLMVGATSTRLYPLPLNYLCFPLHFTVTNGCPCSAGTVSSIKVYAHSS